MDISHVDLDISRDRQKLLTALLFLVHFKKLHKMAAELYKSSETCNFCCSFLYIL